MCSYHNYVAMTKQHQKRTLRAIYFVFFLLATFLTICTVQIAILTNFLQIWNKPFFTAVPRKGFLAEIVQQY